MKTSNIGLKISIGKFLSEQIPFQKRILPRNLSLFKFYLTPCLFKFYFLSEEDEKGTNICLSSFFIPSTATSTLFSFYGEKHGVRLCNLFKVT